MTEQMKYVLKELNETLGTKYDLIKFDALSEKQILQVLIDLLVHFNAGTAIDVFEDDPEAVSLQLLEMLSNVKYRPPPSADAHEFRNKLLAGDAKLVHGLLAWMLKNKEQVRSTAYLAKYLKLPDIPMDVQRNSNIQDQLELYQTLMDEFKEVHKRTRLLANDNGAEIINDIKEMAVERDIVIKRLENVQVNLIDVNEKEDLLNVSRSLRLQQERTAELSLQYETQQSQLKVIGDQLKRYLSVFYGQSSAPKSADDVIKHLHEEIQLNDYLVKEKLPLELSLIQKELSIVHSVLNEQNLTRSDLMHVQDKINKVNSETETLVQQKMMSTDPQEDKLKPFRQQATLIRRNKEAAVERVQALTDTLREHEATLAGLQSQVQQLLGDTVLRGDELKKYVNMLRNKSSIYKRQRATLNSYKVEAGILTRTLHIISNVDPTVEVALLNHKKLKVDDELSTDNDEKSSMDLTKRSLHDLSQMVAQTAQKVSEIRQETQPLADRLKPTKSKFQNVQQQYEQKKRVHEATSINITSQMEPLKEQVKKLNEQLNGKEEEWKMLRQKITKAENLQEVVAAELKNSMHSPRKPSKMENLKKSISEMEATITELEEKQQAISSRQSVVEEQTQLWSNVLQLLDCKLRHRQQAPLKQGHMIITNKSQTLTLQ